MNPTNIIALYFSVWIVLLLHELGHMPKKIKINNYIIPSASAIGAPGNLLGRLGGLIVNVAIFYLVYYMNPDNFFIKTIGLVAFVHFILYAIFGSIIPEPKPSSVKSSNYVFDDVPNEYWFVFFILAGIFIYYFGQYYYDILVVVLG